MLSTILGAFNLTNPNDAASAPPIDGVFQTVATAPPPDQPSPPSSDPSQPSSDPSQPSSDPLPPPTNSGTGHYAHHHHWALAADSPTVASSTGGGAMTSSLVQAMAGFGGDRAAILIHAVEAPLVSDSTNGNIGEISWHFSVADHYFDFLSADESLSATYNIAVTDNQDAASVEPVTIVINGTNDNPTAVPDSNGVAKASTLSVGASTGVLANDTDPDAHDHLVVSAVNGSAADVGQAVKGTYGSLTLNADGSYAYAANKGALPSQIVAQDTFNFTVSDGHGGTDTSTLSVVAFNPGVIYQSGTNTTLTGAVDSKNVLVGSAGHDVLIGGSAADVLIGGKGDTLTGGGGPDTFVFRPNLGTNVITDFNVINEAVQIDKSIFATAHDVLAHTTDTPAGAVINDGHGDTITLAHVTLAQLQAHQNDFLLI